jgi:D-alanyl-D-alanine carboxypeptidase
MRKFLVFLFLNISVLSFTQINTNKLDSLFTILKDNHKAMGNVALYKNGQLLYSNALGTIDEKKEIAANANTKYRIGSISKMFTAVLIFQLIEEKKLTLSTPLSTFFATIPQAKKITIEQMLHHSSGIKSVTEDSTYFNWHTKNVTQVEMVKKIATYSSTFEPNKKVEYSNSNYILLGYIVEKITKKTLAKNIEERIAKKIGLNNTYYGSDINAQKNEAVSYNFNGKQYDYFGAHTNMSVPSGAGSIVSTATDLCIFIENIFNLKLVNKASLDKMQTIEEGMGYGMFSFPFGKKKAYGHNGSIDGFNSMLGYFPKDSVAVSYISNGTNYSVNNILIGVLSIYFNEKYKLPNFSTTAVNVDLLQLVGNYKSNVLPIKIAITTDGKILFAQATGQSSFPLDYQGNNTFKFEAAGIELVFDTAKKQMTLKQGGQSFIFDKEN